MPLLPYSSSQITSLIDRILTEDLSTGDITTNALIPAESSASGTFVARANGVIAGLNIAKAIFERVDPDIKWEASIEDGDRVHASDTIATISGCARHILAAERSALNTLQRMSGIATMTALYVEMLPADSQAVIVDTRKTAPGLRLLDKYAVWLGGGQNHRFSLSDGVLIKDNHLNVLMKRGLSLAQIIARAKERVPHTFKIEIEVSSVDMALEAARAGADIVMLDNMSPSEVSEAVTNLEGLCTVEVSGGINLDTIAAFASTGAKIISVGALTHSVQALDIALEFESD